MNYDHYNKIMNVETKRLGNTENRKSFSTGVLRKVVVITFVMLSGLLMPGLKAQEIFADLSDMSNVESVYVSGRFAHNYPTWRSMDGKHAMNLRGFSALYIYQCYSIESVNKASEILKSYLKKNPKLELVMSSKEIGGEYKIYETFNKDNKLMEMIIWNCEAKNMCEIVVVKWKDGLERGSDSQYSDYQSLLDSDFSNLIMKSSQILIPSSPTSDIF